MAGVVWSESLLFLIKRVINKKLLHNMFIDMFFSNGFDKIGSTEMGLKFEGSDLLPDLKRGDNFCFLKYLGEGVLVNTKVIYIYIG